MALLAKYIPEDGREFVGLKRQIHLFGALQDEILGFSGDRDARKVTLDVSCEYRNARARKTFGQNLQRDCLAGAGCAGHKAMPVCEPECEVRRQVALADEDRVLGVAIAHRSVLIE